MKKLSLLFLALLVSFGAVSQTISISEPENNSIKVLNESFDIKWPYKARNVGCADCDGDGICNRVDPTPGCDDDVAQRGAAPANSTNSDGTDVWSVKYSKSGSNTSTTFATFTCTSGTCSTSWTPTESGTFTLTVQGNGHAGTVTVIIAGRPSNPAAPTEANSSTCYNRVLQRSGTPPANVTYYWQDTQNGTSTTKGSGSTLSVGTGTYYLRARNTATGLWSTGTTAGISVTEYSSPSSYTISAGSSLLCSNTSTSISFSNSQSGYTYRLLKDGSEQGTKDGANGSGISWSSQGVGKYRIQARPKNTSCAYVNVSSEISVGSQTPGDLTLSASPIPRNNQCPDDEITLSVSGGSGYHWFEDGDGTGDTGTSIKVYPQPGKTITYSVTGKENKCNTTKTKSIRITGLATVGSVSITSGPEAFCQGSVSTSNYGRSDASNASGYTWTLAPAHAGTVNSSGVVTWDAGFNGEAKVRVTATGSCSSSSTAEMAVTVYATPTAFAFTPVKDAICEGEQTALTLAQSQTGMQYQLFQDGEAVSGTLKSGTNDQPLTWSSRGLGDYHVVATRSDGQCDEVPMDGVVTLTRQEPGVLLIEFDKNLRTPNCPDDEITLTPSGGSGYEWLALPQDLIEANDPRWNGDGSITVNPVEGETTVYEVSGWESFCQTEATQTISITGEPLVRPFDMTSGDEEICLGTTSSVYISEDAEYNIGYEWRVTPASAYDRIEASEDSPQATVFWNSNFHDEATVIVKALGRCESSWTATRTVYGTPEALNLRLDDAYICVGEQTDVIVEESATDIKYQLYRGDGTAVGTAKAGTGGELRFTTQGPGLYSVEAYREGGSCAPVPMNNTVEVFRQEPGEITITSNPSLRGLICEGDEFTLIPNGGYDYEWLIGDELRPDNGPTPFHPEAGVPITVILEGTENLCHTRQPSRPLVIEGASPVAVASITAGTVEVCPGEEVNYTYEIDENATGHSWDTGGRGEVITDDEESNIVTIRWDADYDGPANLRLTVTGVCDSEVADELPITVKPNTGAVDILTQLTERNTGSGTDLFSAVAANATDYSWSIDPADAGAFADDELSWSTHFVGMVNVSVSASGDCGADTDDAVEIAVKDPTPRTMTSPIMNQLYTPGEQMDVIWEIFNPDYRFDIYLVIDGVLQLVASDIQGSPLPGNEQVYSIQAPTDLGSFGVVIREIRDLLTYEVQDVQVVQPIVVSRPTDADCFAAGEQVIMEWSKGDEERSYFLELWKGGVFEQDIAEVTGGRYEWTSPVDLLPGQDYAVRVRQDRISSDSEIFEVVRADASYGRNFVKTYVAREPIQQSLRKINDRSKVQEGITYFDGVGRPVQSIAIGGSNTPNQDIVTSMVYDGFGRQTREYLPYVITSADGQFHEDGEESTNQEAYYQDIQQYESDAPFAYSEVELELSPRGRQTAQAHPGDSWKLASDNHIELEYLLNDASDNIRVLYTDRAGQIFYGDRRNAEILFYQAGELTKVVTYDENEGVQEGETIEFTNKRGQVIVKQVKIAEEVNEGEKTYAQTYYIYDDFGDLRHVVQPEGVREILESDNWDLLQDEDFQARWVFSYDYDQQRRMIRKRVPGADWVEMVYDDRDRLVLTQDGNNRKEAVVPETFDKVPLHQAVDSYEGKNFYVEPSGSITFKPGFEVSGRDATDGEFKVTTETFSKDLIGKLWQFTKYDYLNRPIITGFVEVEGTPEQVRNEVREFYNTQEEESEQSGNEDCQCYGEILEQGGPTEGYSDRSFPRGVASKDLLTVTYYDNYDFLDPSEVLPEGEGGITHAVKGQATGSKTRQLGSNLWLTEVMYYDDRYRVIERVSTDHLGGEALYSISYRNDISSLIETEERRQTQVGSFEDGASDTRDVLPVEYVMSYEYDHMDRLMTLQHSLNTSGAESGTYELLSNQYNDRGELITKNLGGVPGIEGDAIQSVDYGYNIRGWLTHINGGAEQFDDGDDRFGMELLYQKDGSGLYNGNIGVMSWKAFGGKRHLAKQAYEFEYDAASRLLAATYQGEGNQSVEGITYDHNGNIESLTRKQRINGVDHTIDQLSYSHLHEGLRSNKLRSVLDEGSGTSANLGENSPIKQIRDYGFLDGANVDKEYIYDPNGNMYQDLNKDISHIEYNHLNLPGIVVLRDTIEIYYTYDAAGIKLRKRVETPSETKVTDYNSGIHYTDGYLEFVQHAEGRAVYDGSDFLYEYNLTDHLGNVRVVVAEPETITMMATMETENTEYDEAVFTNIAETRTPDAVANHTPGGDEVARVNNINPIGPFVALSVAPGDEIDLSVYAYYEPNTDLGDPLPVETLASALVASVNPANLGLEGGNPLESQFAQDLGSAAVVGDEDATVPRGYLNYLLYDDDLNLLQGGFVQISNAAAGALEELSIPDIVVEEVGYLMAYVSNESDIASFVSFDDFSVTHTTSGVKQVQDYYPFGLTFNEWTREPENLYKYNQGSEKTFQGEEGKFFRVERQQELQIDMTKYRMYDYALGRFTSVDPKADLRQLVSWSPYNYVENNPIRWNDPYGDCRFCPSDIVKGFKAYGSFVQKSASKRLNQVRTFLKKHVDGKFQGNDRNNRPPGENWVLDDMGGEHLVGDGKGGAGRDGKPSDETNVKQFQDAWGFGPAPGAPGNTADVVKTVVSEGQNAVTNAANTIEEFSDSGENVTEQKPEELVEVEVINLTVTGTDTLETKGTIQVPKSQLDKDED